MASPIVGAIVLILALLFIGGAGGAYYYFNVYQSSQDAGGDGTANGTGSPIGQTFASLPPTGDFPCDRTTLEASDEWSSYSPTSDPSTKTSAFLVRGNDCTRMAALDFANVRSISYLQRWIKDTRPNDYLYAVNDAFVV